MPELHDQHMAAARRRLAHLGGLAARTAAAEQRILEAAEARLEAVNADLSKLRPRIGLDDEAADRHQALLGERAQLNLVIGRSRQALAGEDAGGAVP